ncbi:MAG: HesA/MoeB/ThiF family protein [Desulfobulbus sp.]|nr:MAG: HesA/MoeB/ThiF family protein [Desulfobulbus sp.]
MRELVQFLRDRSTGGLLPLAAQTEAAVRYGLTVPHVEEIALTSGILPTRYQRNRDMFSLPQQLALFRSRVAVVGCGGLGGYIIEELARLGIGGIVAIDPDVFQEHNLNRQLYSTPDQLGRKKVEAAASRVAAINPAVTCRPVAEAFDEQNGPELLRGIDVAVDGLDSIPARLLLAEMCERRGIPMVHGAIAGWSGRLATQFPGDRTLERLYSGNRELPGIEVREGNPSFTPAVVAALEVAEVVKILLRIGEPIRHRCLSIDLFHLEFVEITLGEEQS